MPVKGADIVALALPVTVAVGNEVPVIAPALIVTPNDNRCVDVAATLPSGGLLRAKLALPVAVLVCDTDLIALRVAELEFTDERVARALGESDENALLVPDRTAERVDVAL